MLAWGVRLLALRRWGFLRRGWCWPTQATVSYSGMVISAVASAIDFSAVPNFDDLDESLVIVYGIDDTIIALSDAI